MMTGYLVMKYLKEPNSRFVYKVKTYAKRLLGTKTFLWEHVNKGIISRTVINDS